MIGIFGLLLIAMVLVVKFCNKTLKIVLSIIIILATIYSVMISIDINRVESFKDVTNNKIIQVEMYMFNKCIAGAIE